MGYLLLSDFKARARITDTLSDAYLSWLLEQFSTIINQETATVFSLQNNTTRTFYGQSSSYFVPIGFWQESGLAVSFGGVGVTNQSLTKDTDYRLIYSDTTQNVICAVRLYTRSISSNASLTITGVYGYSNGLPADLSVMVYRAVLTAYAHNKNKGLPTISQDKVQDVSIQFSNNLAYAQHAEALSQGNLMAVPAIASMLLSYRFASVPILTAL